MFKKYLYNAIKRTKTAIRGEDGFSLLEAAIGLMIIGLIAVPVIHEYKTTLVKDSRTQTRGSLANIEHAINQHYGSGQWKYPCPAGIGLREGSADFGLSGDCTLANIKLCIDPLWPTTEGICKTEDTPNAVIIGAVPFTTLKMQQEKALDFWGNKIIYAVTLAHTDSATFTGNNGEIRVNAVDNPVAIQDGSEDGVPEQKTDNVDFFLFSTGATGIGGYTKDGVLIQACGAAADGFEHENCDFDNRFFYDVNPADDAASAYSDIIGVNFFDDMTRAQSSLPEQIWFQHPDNNVYADDFLLTLSTRIGIGTVEPQATIEVVGNIRTNNMLKSDGICNSTSVDCFDPELITGTMDAMKCDPVGDTMAEAQGVMQLAENQVYCNSTINTLGDAHDGIALRVNTAVIGNIMCPTGDLVSGIDASGDIICVTP